MNEEYINNLLDNNIDLSIIYSMIKTGDIKQIDNIPLTEGIIFMLYPEVISNKQVYKTMYSIIENKINRRV